MATLYELAREYVQLAESLGECETPAEASAILEQIETVNNSLGDKAEAYARIIQAKEREAEGYAAEIRRLQAHKAVAESVIERLRSGILGAMQDAGASKLNTSIGVWSARTNPPSVQILDESSVPEQYKEPQPSKINRRAILETFRETGEIIPGTEIIRTKRAEFR